MSRTGGAPDSGGAPIAYLPWVQSDAVEVDDALQHASTGSWRSGAPAQPRTFIEAVQLENDEADRADELVLKKLARSGLSQREVEVALAAELSAEQVQFNVERYLRLGYIDDERLAEHIVRVQRDRKGLGRLSLRRELSTRGIPEGIIEAQLGALDDDAEFELASTLAANRLRRLLKEPREVQERRVSSFLQRRGYSASVAARALSSAREELETE